MSDSTQSTSFDQIVSLAETAAEAAVQRALFYTSTPVTRQGTVAVVDTFNWIHQVQLDGDSFNTQAHDITANGAFVGARVTVLFTPPHQALIIAAHRAQTGWRTWTVDWTTDGGTTPALNDGTLTGSYQRRGQSCDVNIFLAAGASTNGGTLGWKFGLPFPAASDVGEQVMLCKGTTSGGANWVGFGYIQPGGQILRPYFPYNSGVSFLGQAQNADGTGGSGTGIPLVGGYSWMSGSNFNVTGSYKVLP